MVVEEVGVGSATVTLPRQHAVDMAVDGAEGTEHRKTTWTKELMEHWRTMRTSEPEIESCDGRRTLKKVTVMHLARPYY
jgi:hypothetical protein